MRIAFSTESKEGLKSIISYHFGRCKYYTIVDIDENNQVKKVIDIDNPYVNNHGPGVVPQFIKEQNVDVMIAGGMGARAADFFKQFNIKVATGAEGTVEESLKLFLNGKLNGYTPCKNASDDHCSD